MLEPTDPGAMAAIGRLDKLETIMQKSLAAAALVAMTITPPLMPAALAADDAPVAVVETEFTPLDEIDRVRNSGCGIDDFEEFLNWYVSSTKSGGWLEQVIWTNYMVKVGKLADPKAPGNWIHRQDYLGQFRITSTDYRFSRQTPAALPNDEFRKVVLTRLGEKQYRVDWRGGRPFAGVEGADRDAQAGAYIFEHKKDCWYLTDDLR